MYFLHVTKMGCQYDSAWDYVMVISNHNIVASTKKEELQFFVRWSISTCVHQDQNKFGWSIRSWHCALSQCSWGNIYTVLTLTSFSMSIALIVDVQSSRPQLKPIPSKPSLRPCFFHMQITNHDMGCCF